MLPVPAASAKQEFSRDEVQRVLQISGRQLRSWERQGLIPERDRFVLNDLLALRTLLKLRESHVPPAQVKRAIRALRERIRDVSDPLTQLRIYSEGGRVRVDIEGNTMEPLSGQLLLNFGPAEIKKLLSFPAERGGQAEAAELFRKQAEAELLFEKGLQMEHSGAPVAEVVTVYEQAVALDPSSTGPLVNLGTIYFNWRKYDKAEDYYKRAVAADPEYALAHFNLGNLYDEQGRRAEALDQYLQALKKNPRYADAHYNLALLYQTAGETMKAVLHWKAYLKIDSGSDWAIIARRELAKLKDATIVRGRA